MNLCMSLRVNHNNCNLEKHFLITKKIMSKSFLGAIFNVFKTCLILKGQYSLISSNNGRRPLKQEANKLSLFFWILELHKKNWSQFGIWSSIRRILGTVNRTLKRSLASVKKTLPKILNNRKENPLKLRKRNVLKRKKMISLSNMKRLNIRLMRINSKIIVINGRIMEN